MWILRTLNENQPDVESRTFRLPPDGIKTIGRSPRADFILDAPLVSRLHCRLTATRDRLVVADLGSTNGTFVNERRVKQAALTPGDHVGVGRVTLVVTQE
ncbi:MAG TPA: FHA domain-containing protein [Nitriliruptorales bacterium]